MKTLLLFILATLQVTAFAQTPVIQFSSGISENQQQKILSDLERLRVLRVDGNNEQANELFETKSLTSAYLNAWLAERAHYFVEEGFDSNSHLQVLQQNFIYPNTLIPITETATKQISAPGSTMRVVMSNKGVTLYWYGKKQNQKLALDIPGLGSIKITSPHNGIFMIGSGLFGQSDSSDAKSMANALLRMKTYFHEARHTDGNGMSLGFFHVVCPIGHQYEGYSACDKNLNGPYQIAAQFLSATIKVCSSCSSEEKESLRNTQLDSQSRIVNQSLNEKFIPVKFNKNIDLSTPVLTLSETCQALKNQGTDISQIDSCKPGAQVSNSSANAGLPSKWDPTPESTGDL